MTSLPEKPPEGQPLPEERLSREQFELVIRRAAELQARAAEDSGEALTEAEVLRIGRELGLSGTHLSRALAEVRGAGPQERGLLPRWLGTARVQASRAMGGAAPEVKELLQEYLVRREYMTVQRRFADRTLFVRGSGLVALVGRAASQLRERRPPLRVRSLEVSVQPLEEGFSFVTLSTSLAAERAGFATGGLLGGGAAGGSLAVFLGVAVAPPAALLGLPVLGAVAYGMRVAYERAAEQALVQLESLLDRLEHGELRVPPPGRNLLRG